MTAQKRRQYGSGGIHQRSSDGRWIGVIPAGWTPRGTRRFITVSCKAELGEAECKRRLKARQAQIARSGVPDVGASNATVKSWGDQWLGLRVKDARPTTYSNDKTAIMRWIIPTIGEKRLDALTPADIRAVSIAVRAAGNVSSTARRVHVVLQQMLKAAMVEGHVVPPRVLLVQAPAISINDREAIPIPSALKLLDQARAQPDGGSRWVGALLNGLRQGECLGLEWPMLDLDDFVADISWQLQALRYIAAPKGTPRTARSLRVPDGYDYRQLSGTKCLVRPKSSAGQRITPLVPWMVAALVEWQGPCPKSSLHALVWPRWNGRPKTSTEDNAAWDQLQLDAGVQHPTGRPYYLHEARHTTATLLLELGIDRDIIRAILGHSTVIPQQDYKHVSQAMARQAMEQMADRLHLRLPAPDPGST